MLGKYYNSMAGTWDEFLEKVARRQLAEIGNNNPTEEEVRQQMQIIKFSANKAEGGESIVSPPTEPTKPTVPAGESFFEKHKLKLIGGVVLAGLAFYMFR